MSGRGSDLAFNAAVTGVAALLDKITHLARLPGAGDALPHLTLTIDGSEGVICLQFSAFPRPANPRACSSGAVSDLAGEAPAVAGAPAPSPQAAFDGDDHD